MGYLIVLTSDDPQLRAQLADQGTARQALEDLTAALGDNTYPMREEAPASYGAWTRVGSVHSSDLVALAIEGLQARVLSGGRTPERDAEWRWVPSSEDPQVRYREQAFLKAPQRHPRQLALIAAGVSPDIAVHGPDRTTETRMSVWMAYADLVPARVGAHTADQIRQALTRRESSSIDGAAHLTRVGGVLAGHGQVRLYCGGNRIARWNGLTTVEQERLRKPG